MYMRQAITTRYLPPTNARGSRIVAQCEAGRVVVPFNHDMDGCDNHAHAVRVLLRTIREQCAAEYGEPADSPTNQWSEHCWHMGMTHDRRGVAVCVHADTAVREG